MLNGYEIAMLLTIAAAFIYMMWRLYRALEQEKREKQQEQNKHRSNEQEYEAALEAIERLIEAEPGTPEGEKFEVLAKMIEEYDDIYHRFNG